MELRELDKVKFDSYFVDHENIIYQCWSGFLTFGAMVSSLTYVNIGAHKHAYHLEEGVPFYLEFWELFFLMDIGIQFVLDYKDRR